MLKKKFIFGENYSLKSRVELYLKNHPEYSHEQEITKIFEIIDKIDEFNKSDKYNKMNFFYWGEHKYNFEMIGCDIETYRWFCKFEPVKEYLEELEHLFNEEAYRRLTNQLITSADMLSSADLQQLKYLVEVLGKNREKQKEYVCFVKNLSDNEEN